MSEKWFDKPMVMSAIQNALTDSYEILYNHTAKHFNVEQLYHIFAKYHFTTAYDDAVIGEDLRRYLAEARALGITQIVYRNVHSIKEECADPKWLQINKDGSHRYMYETSCALCLNDDYTAEVLRQIKALCAYDIQGIFWDGPVSTGPCYCPHCLKLFSEMFGKHMDDATDAELLRFNAEKVNRFLKICHDAVKAINPDIIVYINNSALRADITGANTRDIYDYVDFLGAEGGFVWTHRGISHWHLSPMAKLIETQAQGKPAVTFIAGDSKPWSYFLHTPEETTIYYAQAIANGTNVWYGLHCSVDRMQTKTGEAVIGMNHFVLDHPEVYTKHKPVSRVALMWGQDTANNYRSSVAESDFTAAQAVGLTSESKSDHAKSIAGCVELLERAHVQFDVIDEVSVLLGELPKYDLVIMPTVACLREGVAEGLEKYVADGGNLITFYDTGFYHQDGSLCEKPQLAALQGIENVNRFIQYKLSGTSYQRATDACDYKKDLSFHCWGGCKYTVDITPAADAKVQFEANEPMLGRYEKFPTKWFPTVIEKPFGKGKSIYFTGDLGEAFISNSNPDLKTVFTNVVKANSRPLVETDAPETMEMVLRKCKEGYALHCINITGEMTHPITRVINLPNVRVSLTLTDIAGEVSSLTGDAPFDIEKTENGISFTIPMLKIYDVITIK